MAHKREESGNRKGFVAIANDAVVDRMFVEIDAEPRNEGVDRDHQ